MKIPVIDSVIGFFNNLINKGPEMPDEELMDDDYYGYSDTQYNDPEYEEYENEENSYQGHTLKTVKMDARTVKMQIVKPKSTDDAQEILMLLKNKTSVVMNLEFLNKADANRIIDYVGGGVFALDGRMEKVSNAIILAVPHNYQIINESSLNSDNGLKNMFTNQM